MQTKWGKCCVCYTRSVRLSNINTDYYELHKEELQKHKLGRRWCPVCASKYYAMKVSSSTLESADYI